MKISCILGITILGVTFIIASLGSYIVPFKNQGPYYAKYVNTDLEIEIEIFGDDGGIWKAIVHPYDNYDEDINADLIGGGLVLNGKELKFPNNENIVVINKKQEFLFVLLENGIFIIDDGRFVDVNLKKLEESEIWQESISPFLKGN